MGTRKLLSFWSAGAALLGLAGWAVAERLEDRDYTPLDNPAIGYRADGNDPVAQLSRKLDRGEVKLDYAPNGLGYLPAVLKALRVPIDSQILVFSKTSTQAAKINPRAPRAIYFNDDVAVGFVRDGDVLEFAALDPVAGVKTYSMDMERAPKNSVPGFGRREDCLLCHVGGITFGVPGLMVASVHPADTERERHGSSFVTDQRTPLKERWGGWYVTGTTGAQRHLGNNLNLADPIHPGPPGGDDTQNVTSLEGRFDLSKYLAPTSDLVALMTLEHQARMTNLLVRVGWDARMGMQDGKLDTAVLNQEIEEMVTYMLFADEEPLREAVSGVSTFSKTFPERGPKDRQGRSLRDFDLKTRLFRYPLSYMIYSAAFDNLPGIVKERVAQRLGEILTGKDESKTFARLSSEDRKAILEIVRETKPGLVTP
jgi:hypothetical protein